MATTREFEVPEYEYNLDDENEEVKGSEGANK